MKDKRKSAALAATLVLTCVTATGALAGCGGKHTHDFSEWGYSATEHWKECPADGVKDESSIGAHVYVAGECECGSKEQTGPIEDVKYGTVTGSVRLYKHGEYVTDKLDRIQIDMGDDDVSITGNVADGKYTFKVDNVKVGKIYNMVISCDGYQNFTPEIMLEEEGEEAKIGGANGVTLKYDVFGLFAGWDKEYHDFSYANDADPYILFRENAGGKTFNAITNDSFGEVAASLRIKFGNSGHNWHTQGIILKFEDGKHLIVRYHNGDQVNGNIQYCNAAWDTFPKENTLFGNDAGLNEWGENAIHTLLSTETAAIKTGDGLDLTLALKDGKLYTFFAGKYISEYALPEGYAEKKVQVGYFAFDATSGARFDYKITDEIPALQSELKINVTKPQGVECSVTAAPAKEVYDMGEEITLNFTAAEGYKLDALTVNGDDVLRSVNNNALTIKADTGEIQVNATFVKEEPIALDLTVKGKKLGTTTVLPQNTTVTFKNTDYSFTVGANGKISAASVVKGRYTVSVNGYFEKEIVFDETLEEVVLEYDLFEIVRWDASGHGLAHVNDVKPYIEWLGGGASLNAIFKENMLGNATVSVTLKGSQTTNGEKQQGILLRFADGKAAILNINTDSSRPRLQFRPELFSDNNDATLGLRTAFASEWVEFNNVTPAEVAKYNSDDGIVLKVVREGKLLYVFLDDVYHGTATLPDTYENAKMGFGLFGYDVVAGSKWYFEVSETAERAAATVTDATAQDANGALTGIPAANIKVGDTVTVTITPNSGYKLKSLTVGGVDVTADVTGTTYKFTVTGDTTVVAEFAQVEYGSINAAISGNKFGVNGNSLTASDTVILSASGFDDVEATITADGNGLKLVVSSIAAGVWKVNVNGYFSTEITIAKNAAYSTAIVLVPDEEFTLIKGWGDVNSVVKSDGSAELTITNEFETAVTQTVYDDIAASVYLGGSGMIKDGATGTQGIVFRFSDNKFAILRMEGRAKIQFAETGWYQDDGTADGCTWQDLIFFTDAGDGTVKDKYLTAFDKGELKLTAVRKGATIYAILTVDGTSEIIGCRTLDAKYLTDKAKVGLFCEGTVNGAEKTWKFEVGDADDALESATPAVGTDKVSYLGAWTDADNKLSVSGKGLIEFKADAATVKESVTIKISAANASNEQGIIYRFADGKYIAVRYQNSTEDATPNGKVQFTMDTVLFTNASLVNWGSDYALTEDEKTSFDGAGIELTFVRDGNKFYVLLGERLLGTQTLDAAYADASGNMGVMIWDGKGVAFAYNHKSGNEVTVPEATVPDET